MVQYHSLDPKDIVRVKPLWEMNRDFHSATSENFEEVYRSLNFDDRVIPMVESHDPSTVRIRLALDGETPVGYCISVTRNEVGELMSMHVHKDQRGKGIGKALALDAIQWMQQSNCKTIEVAAAADNEATIGFYQSLGWKPFALTLRLKEQQEGSASCI